MVRRTEETDRCTEKEGLRERRHGGGGTDVRERGSELKTELNQEPVELLDYLTDSPTILDQLKFMEDL